VKQVIDDLGYTDLVQDVAMQGSFEKGTDLALSGSDLDLFIIFKKNVSDKFRDDIGLQIGQIALNKDFSNSQGWNNFTAEAITATSKYAQVFFDYDGQKMEVQVVSTRHLDLDEIKQKQVDGEQIKIGMERTPHQTAYMKKALKGKENEVRVLKKFMKEAGIYGSNLKDMGFSGYSVEVLIDKFGTFENSLKVLSELKKGDVIDKNGDGNPRHEENFFSIIDPIDPNRDLVTAFSDLKIAKTIKTAKHFLENGELPKSPKPIKSPAVTISFKTTINNEDQLFSQMRKTQRSMLEQLKMLGFNIPTKTISMGELKFDIPRSNFTQENGIVKMSFGMDNLTIPETYIQDGPPIDKTDAVAQFKQSNQDADIIEKDGKIKARKKRRFITLSDALKFLTRNPQSQVKSTEIKKNMSTDTKISVNEVEFEQEI